MLRSGRRRVALHRCGGSLHTPCLAPLARSLERQSSTDAEPRLQPSPSRTDAKTPSGLQAIQAQLFRLWTTYRNSPLRPRAESEQVLEGFLGKQRRVGKLLSFSDLVTSTGEVVQLCSRAADDAIVHAKHQSAPAFAPVRVLAVDEPREAQDASPTKRATTLRDIEPLNSVAKDLIVSRNVQFPPSRRHLQIRFHPELQARLRFRSWLKGRLNQHVLEQGHVDVETPTLFKSNPEGAREFLVPTRRKRAAYALSQSPQQYKQVLMASGIGKYMQWARCYRDEDARADRQPEFTQLDLEWAYATAADVIKDVTNLVVHALSDLRPAVSYKCVNGSRIPLVTDIPRDAAPTAATDAHEFTTMTYAHSMAAYGTDKPDLRIPNRIHAIRDLSPVRYFVSMITNLTDPLVEFCILPLGKTCSPEEAGKFVTDFMDASVALFAGDTDSMPQILVCDSKKPLRGFSSLGPEYESVLALAERQGEVEGEVEDGDLVIFQARQKPAGQCHAGSTTLGQLRSSLWRALVDGGYMKKPPSLGEVGSLQFVWVTEFPMFHPTEDGEPGQGGAAGLSACHHPFTAPLSDKDFELLFTEPLQAKSAAYDLVLNGVEIGGGSERIHVAEVQDFIMRDVLRMPSESINGFSHLFEALRAGCPPHAGFALGFDRLVALMTDTSTVRDVIAFPKTMKGEDSFVGSPSKLTDDQLAPYGLRLRSEAETVARSPADRDAGCAASVT